MDTEPVRRASITAGVGLLVMAALAGFANFAAVGGLVSPGDATQTANDIVASAGLFRLGVASFVVVVALDVVVAWALFGVFRTVSLSLSALAAVLRLVYSAVFLVAIGQLLGTVRLLTDPGATAAFGVNQVNAQAMLTISAFSDIWYAAQLLFGAHLVLIGYLSWRSGFVPRLLAALLVLAGVGYAVDSLAVVLLPGPWTPISSFTFLGEFLLALWLLIRARHIALSAHRS